MPTRPIRQNRETPGEQAREPHLNRSIPGTCDKFVHHPCHKQMRELRIPLHL